AYRSLKAIPKASSLFVPRTVHEGPTKGGAKCEISPGTIAANYRSPHIARECIVRANKCMDALANSQSAAQEIGAYSLCGHYGPRTDCRR
ncbi:MAG: hypothetical protein ACK5HO_12395, partial [Pseudomonadota bacterium]